MNLLLAATSTLIFCAPGYPGAAGDAQPLVDKFASAAATAAGWPAGSLSAVYDPTEPGGLAKLGNADAVLAFVPYPFYVEHASQLHLVPIAQADVTGTGPRQRWTLVAKTGRANAAALAGYTVASSAGYAPEFVRHAALEGSGLPENVQVQQATQILSTLRKIASGEPLAALLDSTQTAGLATLPFAADVKAITQSGELPVAFIAVVGGRLPEARARSFQAALLKMGHDADDSLAALQLKGFVLPQLPGKKAP